MKVLRSILAAFLLCGLLVGIMLFMDGGPRERQYHDSFDDLMAKYDLAYKKTDDVPVSSIAQEIYFVTETNSTVNVSVYYDHLLPDYDKNKLPDFLNPPKMLMEYQGADWDGTPLQGYHTIIFDDGSVISAEIIYNSVLHVSYFDGLVYPSEEPGYAYDAGHRYNLYVLPNGTRISGRHNTPVYEIVVDDQAIGCIAFEDNLAHVVINSGTSNNPYKFSTYELGFDFNDVVRLESRDNGAFVFSVVTNGTHQLWRCDRWSATLIEEQSD